LSTIGPPAAPGLAIGLLGGSFDPPHAGHLHVTRLALARLGLDRVWWLVSPGNPLKPRAPADIARRLAAARALTRHPRVTATDVEARLGTRFTADTLRELMRHYPGVGFVWLMGADNMAGFHRWERWDRIMAATPIAVLPRPGAGARAGLSPAARRFARARRPAGPAFASGPAPRWTMVPGPTSPLSSTALRARGVWP
jgi:nicotinate-nucleotide adenylyltransferase